MLPLLLPPIDHAVPHLAKNDLLVVSESGGQLGYAGRLVVRADGTATYSKSMRGGPAEVRRWRFSAQEIRGLRSLILTTDFDVLHGEPRATYPPSAADGIDRMLAVRQGARVRGWSNAIWLRPSRPIRLFERIDALIADSRSQ